MPEPSYYATTTATTQCLQDRALQQEGVDKRWMGKLMAHLCATGVAPKVRGWVLAQMVIARTVLMEGRPEDVERLLARALQGHLAAIDEGEGPDVH